MNVLKRVGILLLLLLFLLLAVLAYVTMTHGGLKRLFSLAQSYVAGELTVAQSSGALVGPATLSNVAFANDDGLSVEIDDVSFDWSPGKLLSRTLLIDKLVLDGITVRLPPPVESEKSEQSFQLRDFALPVNADVQNILITDLAVYSHGSNTPFVLDEIRLDATGRESALKLVELSVTGPTFTFGMDGTLDTRGAWPVKLHPQWTFSHETAGMVAGAGSMIGDTESLRVLHKVTGPAALEIDAVLSDVTGEISWDGAVTAGIDNLGVIAAGAEGVPLKLDASSKGSVSGYELIGRLDSGHPVTGDTSTQFTINGDLNALTISESTTTVDGAPLRLSVNGTTEFDGLQSDLYVNWTDLQWPLQSNGEVAAVLVPGGAINLNGTPDQLRVTGETQVSSPEAGSLNVMIDTLVSQQVVTITNLSASPVGAEAAALNLQGEIDLNEQLVSLDGTISQFSWPLNPEDNQTPLVAIAAGEFSVTGPLDNYQLALTADVDGKDIPAGTWVVSADGSQAGLEPLSIVGETLQGQINGSGKVFWQPSVEWQLTLQATGIDPSVQWPDLQGDINLQLISEGSAGEEGLTAQNRIVELSGTYQQQPLRGDGAISIDGSEIIIDQLALSAGDALLTASGSVGEELNIQWNVNLPDLSKLVPETNGNIKLNGSVTGLRDAPASDFSLAADNLVSGGVSVGSLTGDGELDISGGRQSSIRLSLEDVVSGGQTFTSVALNGTGTPAQHNIELKVAGDIVEAVLAADGSIEAGEWKGVVETLNLNNSQVGEWKLAGPVTIEAGAKGVTADPVCLQSDPATVCVDGAWDSDLGSEAQVSIDSLDSGRFAEFMPPDFMIDALVNGTAEVKAAPGASLVVVADITVPGGTMDYLDAGEPKSTTLGNSRIQLDLRDDNLKSKVDLDLGQDIGTVNAATSIGELSGARNLGGSVKTDIKDIAPFSAFAPGLDSLDGALNTDMKLAGSMDKPRVVGDSELDALVLEVPSVAMKLIDGKIIARSDGKGGLTLSGTATSGDGVIELTGSYDPAARKLDARVKGENFRVANAKRQRAEISPDINIKMDGDDINVSGLLHIPSAFIDAGGSSGLVKESPDVVLVNDAVTEEDAAGSRLTIDVRVTLGDDIRVKAGQFSGALAGELAVEQAPDGVPTGVGAIEVVSGDFVVYGQTLTMERGRIIFGGGPVTNPALEFDVARDVAAYEVKAGALIRGTAQAPLLQLQSEPAQTDANTLSYILLGRPVDNAGISYTLGKYITPDIYVSYERDLFTKVQTFSVRYRIHDRLTLLASSSDDVSGSDLVYTFER